MYPYYLKDVDRLHKRGDNLNVYHRRYTQLSRREKARLGVTKKHTTCTHTNTKPPKLIRLRIKINQSSFPNTVAPTALPLIVLIYVSYKEHSESISSTDD